MRCTWKECRADGTHPQLGKTGGEWAVLCQTHHDELEAAMDTLEAKPLLRAWARAGHGHRAREDFKRGAAEGVVRLARLFKAGPSR